MRQWLVGTAVIAALAGCAAPPVEPDTSRPDVTAALSRAAREADMNSEWQNRRLQELLVALGRPVMLMDIPGGGNPPGFVVVYGPDAHTGCIDAFAITAPPQQRVRVYHCR